jgi:hypothetical protein
LRYNTAPTFFTNRQTLTRSREDGVCTWCTRNNHFIDVTIITRLDTPVKMDWVREWFGGLFEPGNEAIPPLP